MAKIKNQQPFAPIMHYFVKSSDLGRVWDSPVVVPIDGRKFQRAYKILTALGQTDRLTAREVYDATNDHNFSGREVLMRGGIAQYGTAETTKSDEEIPMIRIMPNNTSVSGLAQEVGLA